MSFKIKIPSLLQTCF